MPFGKFLESIDPVLFDDYKIDRMKGRTSKKSIVVPDMSKSIERLNQIADENELLAGTKNILEMPDDVRQYILSRKIPNEIVWKYFRYTDDFRALANRICPDTFAADALKFKEQRLVILMYDFDGSLLGIQGRSLNPKSRAKYITIKRPDKSKKIFGLDRIDRRREVIVLEGPIDSCFVENGIGVCGADLVSQVRDMKIDPVFCFDNEPFSPIITKKVGAAIDAGLKVVVYDRNVRQKDINDMVLAGIDVNDMIKRRTFFGLRARVEFTKWKRC